MSNERCTIKFPPGMIFLTFDDEPYMQTKNGVYWCSLEICMTSDNYHSLDQDNRVAFAADQLLDRRNRQ